MDAERTRSGAPPDVRGTGPAPADALRRATRLAVGAAGLACLLPAAAVGLGQALLRAVVTAVVDQVDVDRIAARIDVDAIAARIDLEAIVGRLDLSALAQEVLDEVDIGQIVRESSSTMAAETVDALRVQGMRADQLLSGLVDRLLLRAGGRDTGPLRPRERRAGRAGEAHP